LGTDYAKAVERAETVLLRQSAINSLRATATIAIRRIRPWSLPTRLWNQILKALPG
jgi:hypothetical protein